MLAGGTLPTPWVKTWARGSIAPWLTNVIMIWDFLLRKLVLVKLVGFFNFLRIAKFFYEYLPVPVENFVLP